MPFFKCFIIALLIISSASANDFKSAIMTKAQGSCETNNLMFTAMKFYKIPLNEKHENYDVFLRVILFFFEDQSLSLRLTKQALLGCQTTSNGEEACSYKPLSDQWIKTHYDLGEKITISSFGAIELFNPSDLNRGFHLTFENIFPNQIFPGGMVLVNFNHEGKNTAFICK